jgi:hypothetical protein
MALSAGRGPMNRPAARHAPNAGPPRHVGTANSQPSDPVERARKRMNYKNKWNRNPVDDSFQISWEQPLREDARVAIIGGGLSGLCCAQVRSQPPSSTARTSNRIAALFLHTARCSRLTAKAPLTATCHTVPTSGTQHRRKLRAGPVPVHSSNPAPLHAQALAERGINSVVFDTGEHGVGGRLASRSTADKSMRPKWTPPELQSAGLMFDHAAQFFTATDPR